MDRCAHMCNGQTTEDKGYVIQNGLNVLDYICLKALGYQMTEKYWALPLGGSLFIYFWYFHNVYSSPRVPSLRWAQIPAHCCSHIVSWMTFLKCYC